MSATGAGYDYSVSTFSPNGRVFQVEYAMKAVEKSNSALGVRCQDGVVLAVEKPLASKMLVPTSNRRIFTADLHAGVAISGLSADARQLVIKARSEAEEYINFYGSAIPGSVLSERVAAQVHSYTLYWYARPYGCSLLLSVYDEEEGPQLYAIEPTGLVFRYFATAIGKNKSSAQSELEKIDFSKITCREAVKELTRILYKLHDEVKDKELEVEISWICEESKKQHVFVPKDVKEEAIRLAKEAKEKEEMEESDDEEEEDQAAAASQ